MERDFMGLAEAKLKDDEGSEEAIDAAPVRSLQMKWSPFSNNNNNNSSQIISFHGGGGGKPPKTGFDSLASNGLVSITTSVDWRPPPPDKQRRQSLPSLHPTSNHVGFMGTTCLRSSTNESAAPPAAAAQLTIFYNGSVRAYDNISIEKAQAIMFLAGNGGGATNTAVASSSSSSSSPAAAADTNPVMRAKACVVGEGLVLNRPHAAATPLWPSPLPVKSVRVMGRPGGYAGGVLGKTSSSVAESETVPQFRQKSLVRFLEKRKERVISSSPYGNNKQSEDCGTPSAAVGGFHLTSRRHID